MIIVWLYAFLAPIVRGLLRLINGKPVVQVDAAFDPDEQYVIVAPHRTWLDPVMLAITFSNKRKIRFLAKQELFKNRLVHYLLVNGGGAIPVDRERPSRHSLKEMTDELRKGTHHIGIFPTGSRFSAEIKDGAATIAKLGKARLLPVVYQGPLTLGQLFSRQMAKRRKLAIGAPIDLPKGRRLTDEAQHTVNEAMKQAFAQLDHELDPSFSYDAEAARRAHEAKRR